MKAWLEPLFERQPGWRRIYVDIPGMGQSPAESWMKSSDDLLEVMLDFVETIVPDQSYTLAGMSYGSLLARGLLHHHRDRVNGILLIAPPLNQREGERNLPDIIVLERDEGLLAELSEEPRGSFETLAVWHNRENWEKFEREIWPGREQCDRQFLSGTFRERRYPLSTDIDHPERPFVIPTLILTGKQDAICGYQDSWQTLMGLFPRATFAVLDGTGHLLPMEQPKMFQALALDWLERVDKQ
ncbi:alpha/beta hydrolase [Paenibacillus sp. WST5]|uniref:Alpha/beta hydrolase n=2 Tax=Paenibacillus sedimenti TaxID=2770274 RepID=A0A926KRS3_9BACL|nr:alpha/beta hydrolase [Paenibacillus sedimenti]